MIVGVGKASIPKTTVIVYTMILAVNARFFAKGPKIASDKSEFLYGRLTKIHLRIIWPVTESKPASIPRTSTITYLQPKEKSTGVIFAFFALPHFRVLDRFSQFYIFAF